MTTLRCVGGWLWLGDGDVELDAQTAHNLYLCFDLCTGGELFDRICAKGNYYEGWVALYFHATRSNYPLSDAADLVRTILGAVQYIHDAGIVHRGTFLPPLIVTAQLPLFFSDLKPENLLFRSKAEDADIMIADFGLSRVMEEEKFHMLTEICGTPGVSVFQSHCAPIDPSALDSTWRLKSLKKVR